MSVATHWYDESRCIIHTTMEDNIASDELRSALSHTQQLMSTTSRRVDVLLDIHAVSRMPGNFLSILANALSQMPPHFGMMVMVGDNTYINSLVMTFGHVYPFEAKRIHLAATLEESIPIIDADREAIA